MAATLLEQLWWSWLTVAGIAMVFASFLVALVYMIGSLLMNDRMKMWAKMELSEVIYSAIIIAIALGSIPLMDGVVQASLGVGSPGSNTMIWMKTHSGNWKYIDLCNPETTFHRDSVYYNVPSCHMKLGIYFLHEIFEETSQLAYKVYGLYIWSSTMADFTINIEFLTEAAGFFTFNPWRGFLTVGNNVKSQVFDYSMKLMMIAKFQEVMLRFINFAVFPVLFVTGTVLRTFMFTRRLGGLLMAIAIVLYFLFPSFYAFGALMMIDIKHQLHPYWCSDTDLNPMGCSGNVLIGKGYDDPPIAPTLYMTGKMPVIGGMMDTKEITTAYDKAKGYTKKEKSEEVPKFNLLGDAPKTMTEQQKQDHLKKVKKEMDGFLGRVAGTSKVDSFLFGAFEIGGPLDVLARLAFFSVFFSFFALLSSIAAIRSVSITLGGDIEIAGLTRLI